MARNYVPAPFSIYRTIFKLEPASILTVRPNARPQSEPMHAERYEVPEATQCAIAECKARGGRIVAVGTTTVRTLESWARSGEAAMRSVCSVTPASPAAPQAAPTDR